MSARTTLIGSRATPSSTPRTLMAGAAALALAMGLGRFAYTPVMPLMTAHAGLSTAAGAVLASANYLGYLIGAIGAAALPRRSHTRRAIRAALITLVVCVGLMPVTRDVYLWGALRLVAGVASAVVLVGAVHATHVALGTRGAKHGGWVFSGVGLGIALSSVLVMPLSGASAWRWAWVLAAAAMLVLLPVAWSIDDAPAPARRVRGDSSVTIASSRPFALLLACYSVEGLGYIIAATFLVAAVREQGPSWLGPGLWLIVGLCIAATCALWSRAAGRWERRSLLTLCLSLQAVGILLPVIAPSTLGSLVGAALFGSTFIGCVTLAMPLGTRLGHPRSAAVLTVGYSIGQVLGPLAVAPLLQAGYTAALVTGGVASLLAAALAWLVGIPAVSSPTP